MYSDKQLKERLVKYWSGEMDWHVPMAELTTFKVGGPAQVLVAPKNRDELIGLLEGCRKENIPYYVVGGGSNLLVSDRGVEGLVIVLGRKFGAIEIQGHDGGRTLIEVEAGCSLTKLLNWCVERELSGLEFAAGIPGTVGGALAMNAGAWGREIKDVLVSLTWLKDGKAVKMTRDELDFGYRFLRRPDGAVIISAIFAFGSGDGEKVKALCRKYTETRRRKQPAAHGLAGSIFKNPEGVAAGKLIEDAGLKGTRVGGALVSEVHANFIVNNGSATADEIFRLMELVRDKVWNTHRVMLEPEVKILGDFSGGTQA